MKTSRSDLSDEMAEDSEKCADFCFLKYFNRICAVFNTLPSGIFAISLFGLFLGMSTTMVYSQLSLFLSQELNASPKEIAALDGAVEFCAFVTRIFSGIISDFLRDRKLMLFIGGGITLFARPLVALSHSIWTVLSVQFLERIGNGLQATPRDALIADLSAKNSRARCFGFSRSTKTFGALLGAPIAMGIMFITSNNFRVVFFCAVIPVIVALICLMTIKPPKYVANESDCKRENPFKRKYLKSLDSSFWKLMLLAIIFELGHFTEHLFPLYVKQFLPIEKCAIVSMCVSIGQVLLAFPIGYFADKYKKGTFIRLCMFLMIGSNLCFLSAQYAFCPVTLIICGALLWGGQLSAIQGLFLSLISDWVHFHLRATAMGVYYSGIGFAYLIASTVCGGIWETFGAQYTFVYSICFSMFAIFLSKFLLPSKQLVLNELEDAQ